MQISFLSPVVTEVENNYLIVEKVGFKACLFLFPEFTYYRVLI